MFYEDNDVQALPGEVLDMKAEREGYCMPCRTGVPQSSMSCENAGVSEGCE